MSARADMVDFVMARKADTNLAEVLRNKPPASLKAVNSDDVQHLADAITAALERQQIAMATAEDQALRHVPWPLRKTLRRIIGSEH